MKIFDIGTNKGYFTDEYISTYPNCEIVCIEANPDLCNYLVQKYNNNKNIYVYHYLVSNESNKDIDFYINFGCDGVSTASKNWINNSRFSNSKTWSNAISIESISLDDLIENTFQPDIIKIDVEGYENTVIRGLTRKVGIIQFEWAEEELESIKDTCNYLQSIGYSEFAYMFGDTPYSHIPSEFTILENLGLFEQLDPLRKDKWGMIFAK
jgi:FkbM family methyltransferase